MESPFLGNNNINKSMVVKIDVIRREWACPFITNVAIVV